MPRVQETEELVVREFTELLAPHGYGAPLVTREGRITRVAFAKGAIGLELELDWRDAILSVLAVRLDGGHVPTGYYVEAGRPCRKHLVNVARERKWPNAPPVPRRVRPSLPSDRDTLMEAAKVAGEHLETWAARLEAEWDEIWR
jgi:hypothetical protein